MSGVEKLSPLLTADERFRLFVAALARRDDQELDRLEGTCPRYSYTAQDWAYTHRKMWFILLSMSTALWNAQTETLCLLALTVMTMAEDDTRTHDLSTKAEKAFRLLMRKRQGKRQGWLRLCRVIAVDPDAVTGLFLTPNDATMEIAAAVYETLGDAEDSAATQAVEGFATAEFDALMETWRDRFE
jgi:hypothetical protein